MQSSSVVRGSICSLWSLPLMRRVIGTAPSMAESSTFSSSALSCAMTCAGVCAARTPAANVPVKRNWRRFACADAAKLVSSSIVVDLTRSLSTMVNCLGNPVQKLLKKAQQCIRSLAGDSNHGVAIPRIVFRVDILNAQGPNGSHLRDVLAGLGPVEVGSIAGQNDYGAGRICFQLLRIELLTQANVEDSGNDCVYPILRVLVWHEFQAARHFDPDHVRAFLRRLTHQNGEPY